MAEQTEERKDLNLYQKLLKITEEIGKIEKTGKNTQQGYAFIEQAQVVAEVRVQLAKWGVMILPETTSRTVDRFASKSGGNMFHVLVGSRYTVVNADNPDEKFTAEWEGGEALDTSDKASNKATTASQKYFLMKLFNISDKDDPDTETNTVENDADHQTVHQASAPSRPSGVQVGGRKPVSDKQISYMFNAVKNDFGVDRDSAEATLCSFASHVLGGIVIDITNISTIEASKVISAIEDIKRTDPEDFNQYIVLA